MQKDIIDGYKDEESQIDLKVNKNLGVYKGAIYANVGYKNNVFTIPYFCSFLIKKWVRDL